MIDKREFRSTEIHSISVFRGKGEHIQGIYKFTDIVEAVDFAKATPPDEQWSMTFSLITTGIYTAWTGEPTDVLLKINGPGYKAVYYD